MSSSAAGIIESVTRRTTALIVEGGAMRGAWAAGVLAAFLYEQGRRQYDFVYAASSGACSAAYFVAGMCEPGLSVWRDQACKAVRKSNLLSLATASRQRSANNTSHACGVRTFCVKSTRWMRLNFSFTAQFVVVHAMLVRMKRLVLQKPESDLSCPGGC
jgi:predicted acylesterase/phospholipase RssA